MTCRLRWLVLSLALLCFAPGSTWADEPARAAASAGPTQVWIGFHVIDVRNTDLREQSFFADLYMWVRFIDPGEERTKEILDKLEVMNGKFDSKEEIDRKTIADQIYVCYRASGTFFFDANLHRYPFDVQRLEIVIENSNLERDAMLFGDDMPSYERSKAPRHLWGVKQGLAIPDFGLRQVSRNIEVSVYPCDFGDPTRVQVESTYSRITFSMEFERDYMSYVVKIVIPLAIVIAMAWLVFWVPASDLSTSSATAITALLTCMAFSIGIAQGMPDIGYLVISDWFFIATYALLLLTLGESLLVFHLDANQKLSAALRVQRLSRILFPLTFVAVFAGIFLDALKKNG